MENLTIIKQDGQLMVTSRQIAENFKRTHKDVVNSIEKLMESIEGKSSSSYFIQSEYKSGQRNRTYKEYLLTRDGFSLLVMGFNGTSALEWKLKYIQAFNEMETQLTKPMTIEELIIMQANSVKDLKAKVVLIEDKADKLIQNHGKLEERFNNLDKINVDGTPRQRLKAMMDKYSCSKGVPYSTGWNEFKVNFNTAYHTNIENKKKHYMSKNKLKNLTNPDYLERTGLIEDALRVADKMLNEVII